MDVFKLRNSLINDYSSYVLSFLQIQDQRIRDYVLSEMKDGLFWPDPLIQLNPAYEQGKFVDQLVEEGILHDECRNIFSIKSSQKLRVKPLRLYKHQEDAIRIARTGSSYVLTTGTGSGKSLAYIIPIVDHVLSRGPGNGIRAIIVYPMNALVNSQLGELERFLCYGYPDSKGPVTFKRYTGQESDEERLQIMANPPDILLTNYVMLELILTRPNERKRLIRNARGLQFLVLDELHTYRGRQGADVAMLVRRVRDATESDHLQCIGTSATLAGTGSYNEKQIEVAKVTSQIFGTTVKPENIIGETLMRVTEEVNENDPDFIGNLRKQITEKSPAPEDYQNFISQPLSIWIETAFGLSRDPETGILIRRNPRGIWGEEGAAKELSILTGIDKTHCGQAIEEWLLSSYIAEPNPETGFPVFAFRLHQFISRGDTVYTTLENEQDRHVTVFMQKYVPGDRTRILFPLVFCRECGQEYYSVYAHLEDTQMFRTFLPRDYTERQEEEGSEPGYVYISRANPWPEDEEEILSRLPEDWLQESTSGLSIRRERKKYLPKTVKIKPNGIESGAGITAQFVSAPFRFCLNCGVAYDFHQKSDFAKLASLGSEGRSTATTILSLSTILHLKDIPTLKKKARKLLSFTDNRQDASLQAGHFNDFVEVGLVRSALYRAVEAAGNSGLEHDEVPQKVFEAIDLPLYLYAADPEVKFRAKDETEAALRDVLGYRIYYDLRRGWRITAPNLEQCGLLVMHYKSLTELCSAEEEWEGVHPCIADASPETRKKIVKVLLDYMRRELAIKVDFLDNLSQERIKQRSSQRLRPPWSIDEDETMVEASIILPRSRKRGDYGGFSYLSGRGGFGQYLRRQSTFINYPDQLKIQETEKIIRQLLSIMKVAGLVEEVRPASSENEVPGYQVPAAAMVWKVGDGTTAFHDPIRIPSMPGGGGRTNKFFVDFYKTVAKGLAGIEAREHTAQVDYEDREEREEQFRKGELPILFCSPTMELGVDIAMLNVVNMRNIPPTPANYAQRSGRAGRSGQPALVFSYCSAGSSHDQYFFKRPENMVSGAVLPPHIDLTNEDLIKAHIHAIWLAETEQDLGTSLKDVLDLTGNLPSLKLQEPVHDSLSSMTAKQKAMKRAENVLRTVQEELTVSDWYKEGWLDEVFDKILMRFDRSCDRWRGLYHAALRQREVQHKIISDASRPQRDKNQAKLLRREAESQLELLTDAKSVIQSDFYSYRYFASEGFLPGYNFPRLPISAYIPGRRIKGARDEYLSRPRFLAISEFGPRAFVYHEGSRYTINKVILPVDREDEEAAIWVAKQCQNCGYIHPISVGDGPDLCDFCGAALGPPMRNLFRLQNVSTKRRDRINCDEEERLRLGFEIRSGVRFESRGGEHSYRTAELKKEETVLAKLTYGSAATIWRINLGWRRRKNKHKLGFVLDTERGYWSRNEEADDEDVPDPMSSRTQRVVPYVEDHKNCLIFEPATLTIEEMATLQSALKKAIQVQYQLEDTELAAEPLPDNENRRSILFYEAAEGGAGVLRQLFDDPDTFAEIAREALSISHFDPKSGEDLHRHPRSKEDCEAACYDCLMSYMNQPDHHLLDRKLIRDILLEYTRARVYVSPGKITREEHLRRLKNLADSQLEIKWLDFLNSGNYRLPSHAQKVFSECVTRPDFYYAGKFAVIYIDGPHHKYPEREKRDEDKRSCMEDMGYTVIRFRNHDDWKRIIDRYPNIFGDGV